MPAVSVIVLVYKVEKYIERCARSLFGQTLEDIEYVFVDDCSTDRSMEILERVLEEYPQRRGQVKILHNEVNRGQAYSRRRGVEASSGDYIIHCDSDDWPEKGMYAALYAKASAENLDMVICGMRRVYPDHSESFPDLNHTEDLLESLLYLDIHHYLLNKLVTRKAYEAGITWPQANMCEDTALITQLAYNCRNWGFVDECLYNYNYSPDSISSAGDSLPKVEQVRANAALALSFIESKGLAQKYARAARHLKCWAKFSALQLSRRYYLDFYPEVNLPFFFDGRFTLMERMGHLTKILGIHGISKMFNRKK